MEVTKDSERPFVVNTEKLDIKVLGTQFNVRAYPDEKCIHLEENEGLISLSGNMLVSSKWIEDPDYREEIIIRDYETTEITERKDGYAAVMPNGEIWMFCK